MCIRDRLSHRMVAFLASIALAPRFVPRPVSYTHLVSGYPLGWKKPGAFPEEKRGVSRLRGSSRRPQSGRLLPGIESFLPGEFRGGKDLFPQGNGLPEEFQRPQGLSDWDWSLRQGEAAEAKSDLERSAALYGVGRTKLNAAKRISEELGRKVVFDGTMTCLLYTSRCV